MRLPLLMVFVLALLAVNALSVHAAGSDMLKAHFCKKYGGAIIGTKSGQPLKMDCSQIARMVDGTAKNESAFADARKQLDARAGIDLKKTSAEVLWGPQGTQPCGLGRKIVRDRGYHFLTM